MEGKGQKFPKLPSQPASPVWFRQTPRETNGDNDIGRVLWFPVTPETLLGPSGPKGLSRSRAVWEAGLRLGQEPLLG